MAKSKIATETTSILSRLYPEQELIYNGVTIEIRPLPYGKVPGAIELVSKMITMAMEGRTSELLEAPLEGLNRLLNCCVSLPESPEIKVEDLPFVLIPEIIDLFIDQNLDLGKLRALLLKRGIDMDQMISGLTSQSLSA